MEKCYRECIRNVEEKIIELTMEMENPILLAQEIIEKGVRLLGTAVHGDTLFLPQNHRALYRAIEEQLVDEIALRIIDGTVKPGDTVKPRVEKGKIVL